MTWLIYSMLYIGSGLMVYNIYGFIRFAVSVRSRRNWGGNNTILRIPIFLLVFFLIGYLGVTFFGDPDLLVAGILFGGSIFVQIIYQLIRRITDRIAESERREAEYMAAEESSRAKTMFLSSMSHEMRTPMNVIIGLDGLALDDPDLSEKTRDYLRKIGASAKHLLSLINNVLELNSSKQEGNDSKKEAFSLEKCMEQVNAIAGTICEEKGLTYDFSASSCLSNWYIGDDLRLKNVLLILLDNAVKFTDAPGKVGLSVTDGSLSDESTETLVFSVSDTGVGIDSEFLPKIFDVFTKGDSSSTDSYGGSGLGLAVAKKDIEACGGTILVKSTKGEGSVFSVTLPMPAAESPEECRDASGAEEKGAEISLSGRRILIVEDIPCNAEVVMDLLELEGASCEYAENGRIALDMFVRSPENYYDAVLMDLRMPEMDGLTATREFRKADRGDAETIPIIALSANAYESDIDQSMDAGMNAHLAKPTDSELLYATLKAWIRKSLPS